MEVWGEGLAGVGGGSAGCGGTLISCSADHSHSVAALLLQHGHFLLLPPGGQRESHAAPWNALLSPPTREPTVCPRGACKENKRQLQYANGRPPGVRAKPKYHSRKLVMETPKLRRASQMSLKGFGALMRWFFKRIHMEVHRKNVMKCFFSHLHVTRRDMGGSHDQFTLSENHF